MDIKNDKIVQDFFLKRDSHPETQKKYLKQLRYFINISGDGLTPTELIKEALQEERAGIYPEDRKIEQRLLKFKAWLINQDYTYLTRKSYLSNIKTFYSQNRIRDLPNIKIKRERKTRASIEDLPTRENIRKICLMTDVKHRAILLLECSSGLAKVDIRHLKVEQFFESINKNTDNPLDINDIDKLEHLVNSKEIIIEWKGERLKNQVPYFTFNSPEATRAIVEYLKLDPPKNKNDYLFRIKGKKMKGSTFSRYFERMNDTIGIDVKDRYKRVISHNMRRWFASQLMEHNVGYSQAEYMLGHSLPPTQEAYYKLPSDKSMREAYLKVVPYLSIIESVEVRTITDDDLERLDQLEKENIELENRVVLVEKLLNDKNFLKILKKYEK